MARFSFSLRGKVRLERYWSTPLEAVEKGTKSWSLLVGEALKLRTAKWAGRGAVQLVMSGQYTLLKFVRCSRSEGIRTDGLFEFEAQRAIPCPLDDVTWDHAFVSEDSGEVETVLAAAKRKNTEALVAETSGAGLRADRLLPASFALLRAFRFNYPEVQERVLLVSVGAQSACFVFIDRGRYFARAFALGGATLTHHIAEGLDLTGTQAEELKRRASDLELSAADTAKKMAIENAAEKFRDRLAFEIERSMNHHCERFGAQVATTFFLAGGGTMDERLAEILANRFSCRVVRYDPLRNIEASGAELLSALKVRPLPVELLGAALAHLQPDMELPDLLPTGCKADRSLRRLIRIWFTALTMGAAGLLPLAIYWQLRLERAESNLARVERQLIPARNLTAKNNRNLASLEKIHTELLVLQRTFEKKAGWTHFMADLQQRLAQVEDVWLEQLQPNFSAPENGSASSGQTISLGGRLLDTENPRSKVSPESYQRVLNLLRLLAQSPCVAKVRDERFDNSQPGILRFHCILELTPSNPL